MNELADIRRRLERLERANRGWRGVAAAALVVAVFLAFQAIAPRGEAQQIEIVQPPAKPQAASKPQPPVLDAINARQITICDGHNKPRLVLTPEGVVLHDDDRTPRVMLTSDRLVIFHSSGAEFTRMDLDGFIMDLDGFILMDGKGHVRAHFSADRGGSYLRLGDNRNKTWFAANEIVTDLRRANVRISGLQSEIGFISSRIR